MKPGMKPKDVLMEGKIGMNIILDMDQTLICNTRKRPHLEIFLEFCFLKFQNVSIWTAAAREWFDYVNENIFTPILNEIRDRYGGDVNTKFDFVFTRDRCSLVRNIEAVFADSFFVEKRLNKLFRSKQRYKDYTRGNTIILDDDTFTFRKNYGNALGIYPYFGGSDDGIDDELICAMIYMIKVIFPHFKKVGTIRDLDKRGWKRFV